MASITGAGRFLTLSGQALTQAGPSSLSRQKSHFMTFWRVARSGFGRPKGQFMTHMKQAPHFFSS